MDVKFTGAVAQFLHNYISEISFSITAVTIMIAGPYMTSFIKRFTKTSNWFIRYCCYMLLCTVGVGVLTKILYQGIRHWLGQQSGIALILWVIGVYLGLALIAKQQKEI